MKKIIWLDYAKVIGLYLMVSGHIFMTESSFVRVLIYAFHMPLFFIISGYLHKKNNMAKSFIGGIKRLIVPFLCFSLLAVLYKIIVLCCLSDFKSIIPMITDTAVKIFLTQNPLIPPVYWFLFALFLTKVSFDIILQIKIQWIQLAAVGFSIILLYGVQNFTYWQNYLFYKNALLCLPFYALGYYLNRYNLIEKFFSNSTVLTKIFACFFLLILLVAGSLLNGRVSCMGIVIGQNTVLFYAVAIVGSIMIIILSQMLEKVSAKIYRVVQILSTGSITVYMTHFYVLYILKMYQATNNILVGIFIPFAVLLCEIPIILLFHKYLPPLMIGGRRIKKYFY